VQVCGRAYAPPNWEPRELPESWNYHLSQWSHAIEETSLQQAAITTAIGAGTAFALLTALLIILLIMGFVAVRIQRRQAEQSAKAELALVSADALRGARATAAVVAVGVLMSRSELGGREAGENKSDEGAVS
jgi:Na+-transporting methylmalonyl-CoA/oxaloacetate decarboxylase gamma subunit